MSIEPRSTYRERTRARLKVIVEDAAGEPSLTVGLELREVGPNAIAHLSIRWRCHPKLAEPDDCERAILELLYRRGRTRHRDVLRLECETWSARTIERRLRRLRRLGVVKCWPETPRGYDLDSAVRAHADANPAQSA